MSTTFSSPQAQAQAQVPETYQGPRDSFAHMPDLAIQSKVASYKRRIRLIEADYHQTHAIVICNMRMLNNPDYTPTFQTRDMSFVLQPADRAALVAFIGELEGRLRQYNNWLKELDWKCKDYEWELIERCERRLLEMEVELRAAEEGFMGCPERATA